MEPEQKTIQEVIVAEIVRGIHRHGTNHADKILDILTKGEKPSLSVSFPVKITRTSKGYRVKTKISYSEKSDEEIEREVEDPRQEKLNIN